MRRDAELADPLFQRYWALAQTGAYSEAIAQLGILLERNPDHRAAINTMAWQLATCPEMKYRDVPRALELAKKAVKRAPLDAEYWNTLGVAHYRAGEYQAAIEALEKSEELEPGRHLAYNAFFLAMAHWQLDARDKARQWFDRAVDWMEQRQAELQNNPVWQEELRRFRSEAESLMEIETTNVSSSAPQQQESTSGR